MCVFVMQKEMYTQLLYKMQLIYEMCMPKRTSNGKETASDTESVREGGARGVCFMYCYIAHIAYTQRLPRACRHIKRTQNRVIQLQVTFKYKYNNFNDTIPRPTSQIDSDSQSIY